MSVFKKYIEKDTTETLDTIDNSNTKELSAKGQKIFGYFGLAFGSIFLIVGIAVMSSGIIRGLKQKNTSNWPTIEGRIISVDLTKKKGDSADSPLLYEFNIDRATYRSTQIAFVSLSNIDYNDWVQLANGIPNEGKVTVHYNPEDPNESVLRAGNNKSSWQGLGFGAIFAGFAAIWMTGWWGISNWLPNKMNQEIK